MKKRASGCQALGDVNSQTLQPELDSCLEFSGEWV